MQLLLQAAQLLQAEGQMQRDRAAENDINRHLRLEMETLRGAVSAHCSQFWGKKTYISTVHKDEQVVELLRVQ